MIIIQTKNVKTPTVFDDMVGNMLSNKKVAPIVIELFTYGKNLTIYIAFIILSFSSKNFTLNSTHCVIRKSANIR